jgi:hypothetical protein
MGTFLAIFFSDELRCFVETLSVDIGDGFRSSANEFYGCGLADS